MAAVMLSKELQPDLVVLDVLDAGDVGVEVVDKIISASTTSKVVLLTSSESEEDLLAAIKAGARGYIVKSTPFPNWLSP